MGHEVREDPSRLHVELDRAQAIRSAIREAREGDVVLIAGKGHEDYQIILDPSSVPGGAKRTIKVPFDDRQVAAAAIADLSKC